MRVRERGRETGIYRKKNKKKKRRGQDGGMHTPINPKGLQELE